MHYMWLGHCEHILYLSIKANLLGFYTHINLYISRVIRSLGSLFTLVNLSCAIMILASGKSFTFSSINVNYYYYVWEK